MNNKEVFFVSGEANLQKNLLLYAPARPCLFDFDFFLNFCANRPLPKTLLWIRVGYRDRITNRERKEFRSRVDGTTHCHYSLRLFIRLNLIEKCF